MTTDTAINEIVKDNGRPPALQHRNLECRICGMQVFAPLLSEDEAIASDSFELTCSKGHTDSYDVAELRLAAPAKPPKRVQVRRAVAGIG